jgi:NAD(P)H-hydrate epimerase
MLKAVTVQQMIALDRIAIEDYGIPSLILMENAGRAVADEARNLLKRVKHPCVSIFCGFGNNAGDGFVAARHLGNAGVRLKIFLVGQAAKLKNDAAVNWQILQNCRIPVQEIAGIDRAVTAGIKSADLIIDALFGVGLNREIEEPFRSVIQGLNEAKKPILSIDIPSGLDGTTGEIYGTGIKADTTVTLSFAKRGFFKKQGPQRVGRIIVADIGLPRSLLGTILKRPLR